MWWLKKESASQSPSAQHCEDSLFMEFSTKEIWENTKKTQNYIICIKIELDKYSGMYVLGRQYQGQGTKSLSENTDLDKILIHTILWCLLKMHPEYQ